MDERDTFLEVFQKWRDIFDLDFQGHTDWRGTRITVFSQGKTIVNQTCELEDDQYKAKMRLYGRVTDSLNAWIDWRLRGNGKTFRRTGRLEHGSSRG